MPTTNTIVKHVAVPAVSRDDNFHWTEGINADQPTYGDVLLIRITTVERRADGDVGRLLSEEKTEEILAHLDAATAVALSASLSLAAVNSLTPVPAKDLRV